MAAPWIKSKKTANPSVRQRRPIAGRFSVLLVTLGSVLLFGVVIGCDPGSGSHDVNMPSKSRAESAEQKSAEVVVPPSSADTTTTVTIAPSGVIESPDTRPPSMGTGVAVVSVIDGDTIKVAGGQKVRLIGIDTPERGQCGYTEAAFTLAALINGRPVDLIPGARDDTDRYGRLLRYIEVDGVDLNLAMIKSGRAIARYDSRDGYGRHPREDSYIAADAASPSTNSCAPPPGSVTTTSAAPAISGGSGGGAQLMPEANGTDPRFGTCREARSKGYGPYTRGSDPEYDWYRDADRDGVVCE